jgi:membrane dipeptidase
MKSNSILLLFLVWVVGGCQSTSEPTSSKVAEKADSLAQAYIITDGHIDLPYRLQVRGFRLQRQFLNFAEDTEGEFDYPKAKAGGLDAPFMSIYVPTSYQGALDAPLVKNRAKILADSLIDLVQSITEAHPDKFALANSPDEVMANFEEGLVSLPMGMENGAPLGDSLENVQYFFDRGIRYITLTHGEVNRIGDSSYDTTRVWNGLSPFGEQVVQEMNRVGIMVDISHVSDSTFYDVMEIAQAPCIASHSSTRYFTPGFERNMNDDMIKLLAENDGVIQINFGSSFIDSVARADGGKVRNAMRQYLEENNLDRNDSAFQAYAKQYMAENYPYADVKRVVDHIDHVVQIAGIDHVGFGSDFDGVGNTLPSGLKTVENYPNIVEELLKRGYTEEEVAKICYQNVFRVWQKVEAVAASMQADA